MSTQRRLRCPDRSNLGEDYSSFTLHVISLIFYFLLLDSWSRLTNRVYFAQANPLIPKDGRPFIVGHLGASGVLPENTLEGFSRAIADGADFVHCTVAMSGDGELVCIHDLNMERITNVVHHKNLQYLRQSVVVEGVQQNGFFTFNFSLAQLKQLGVEQRFTWRDFKFHGRLRIPTVGQFLDLVISARKNLSRPIGIVLELRHAAFHASLGLPLEESLLYLLQRYSLLSSTTNRSTSSPNPDLSIAKEQPLVFGSFEPASLRFLRNNSDALILQFLSSSWNLASAAHPILPSIGEKNFSEADLLTEIATYADGIAPEKRLIVPVDPHTKRTLPPTDLASVAHSLNLAVFPRTFANERDFLAFDYNADPYEEYAHFVSQLQVDGLFTDFPSTAVNYLRTSSCKSQKSFEGILQSHDISDLFLLFVFVVLAVTPMVVATLYAVYKWRKTEQYVLWQELTAARSSFGPVAETETEPLASSSSSSAPLYRTPREQSSFRRSQVRKTEQAMEIEWL